MHISLSGGGTFFFLRRRVRRSMQLHAAIHIYPRRQNSLRGEKKKQTSRRNLGVKWIVGSATFAAIAFIWQRLSGRPMLELFRETLSQRRRQRQLPFEDHSHGLAEWDRHARAEPNEAAWACYRGTVGLVARVHGPGGGSGRPRRRVATRVSILSGIGKKDDLVRTDSRWYCPSGSLRRQSLADDPDGCRQAQKR